MCGVIDMGSDATLCNKTTEKRVENTMMTAVAVLILSDVIVGKSVSHFPNIV